MIVNLCFNLNVQNPSKALLLDESESEMFKVNLLGSVGSESMYMSACFRLLLLILILSSQYSFCQINIPIGSWRSHLSYRSSTTLALGQSGVYAGSNDGFFFFEKEYNSIERKTKQDGFSEVSVDKLKYSSGTNTLIIAYTNGNIDLWSESEIFNIPTLKNARTNIPIKINHILVEGPYAFISCSFGLAVLNIQRREITEIYQYIGPNAAIPEVFASAFYNQSLVLATSLGILKGQFDSSVNLQDFNNWSYFNTGIPPGAVQTVVNFEGKLFAGKNNSGIYKLENSEWTVTTLPPAESILSMQASQHKLYICQDSVILEFASETFKKIESDKVKEPYEAEQDVEGYIWVADRANGLIKIGAQGAETINPSGPYSNQTQRLEYLNQDVIALPGGYTKDGYPLNLELGFYKFSQGIWRNYNNKENIPFKIPPLRDFISSTYDSQTSSWYFGSYQDGIIRINADNGIVIYNHTNSPLQGLSGEKITDIKIDAEGNLWVLNPNESTLPSLHKKKLDESWESFTLNHSLSKYAVQMIIDSYNQKWLRINADQGEGLLVYNETTGKTRYLSDKKGEGGLHNTEINDMALDKTGALWLATNNGMAVFYSTYIDNIEIDATRPIFGTQYLLKDSKVNCVYIDEGDRKWIGTQNGLWLFNAEVSEVIHHFTTTDSPLLSNNILDVTINNTSGEVFIATDKGIISYRSTATEATESFSKVKVFPNPIYPNFKGIVGISGLASNAYVKITDVTGKLIYRTQAAGGTASWNLSGRSLPTGVYLIFSITEDGKEGIVSKVAIIE